MQIPIPDIFTARNFELVWNQPARAQGEYRWATNNAGKAGDCVACGQCEAACPQHINIIEQLKLCAKAYD